MIIMIHENAEKVEEILRDDMAILMKSSNLIKEFWRLAIEFPQEIIMWVDKRFYKDLNIAECQNIFHHDLIMTSFSIREQFFPPTIGYVDQSPFINPKYNVLYGTWRMSTNVGGIKGATALAFKEITRNIHNFGYLLNSIAKIGQQNSLFCYSDPSLIKTTPESDKISHTANTKDLFNFVYQFYKTEWLLIMLFCFLRYELRFPLISFIGSFFRKKQFNKAVDLSSFIENFENNYSLNNETIDVIIPTLKRPEHVKQVLHDLKIQTFLPSRVIIIEQDPEKNSVSKLEGFLKEKWPFEIIHQFIHNTGACKARNIALQEVTSKWIFFADDDIRLSPEILHKALLEINRLGISIINLNCKQEGEKSIFRKIKQWGTFGSGTSIVLAKYALQCDFKEVYEHGFGEDIDFGLQLRSNGADVIYHPDIEILHLKAERGGFRENSPAPWLHQGLEPKPSPTMMLLIKTHYNRWMLQGYKISLFIKYYPKQAIKNPIRYLRIMKRKWQLSEEWALKLSAKHYTCNN